MIEVAAAIIYDPAGRILIARRRPDKSQGGMREFPGGKLEAGEEAAACLIRELKEEMSILIRPRSAFGINEHHYGSISIRLIAWQADYVSGSITLSDHDDYRWILPEELSGFTFAAADIPFVQRLLQEA